MSEKKVLSWLDELPGSGFGNPGASYIFGDSQKEFVVNAVKSLSPKQGDIIVLYYHPDGDLQIINRSIEILRICLNDSGYSENNLLILPEGQLDLRLLDEKEMESTGWVRKQEKRGYEFL